MKILHPNSDGGILITFPSDEWKDGMQALAKKVVAKGDKFKIVEDNVIPNDREFRDAWEWDFSDFDGYGENEG
jgi:hypothetical protein